MQISPNASPEEQRRLNEYWANLRNKKKPMQASPSAQQAVPQAVYYGRTKGTYDQEGRLQQSPMLPPELQRIQAMGMSLQLKLQNDSFLQGIRQQQEKLGAAIQQKQQNYLNSVQQFFNTAPPELKQFLSSPQVMQNLVTSYQRQQPEIQQLQNLVQQQNQYVQTNYGEEQRRLQDLQMQFNQQQGQPKQAQPTASKFQLSYFPPDANYEIRGSSVYMNGRNIGNIGGSRGMYDPSMLGLPNDGSIKIPAYVFNKATYTEDKDVRTTLPPSNINNNAQAAAIKEANEKFKEIISRSVQPPQQDPIVDPLRPSTTVPKTITPIERPPVQPIVDPKREAFTPDTPTSVDKGRVVDPLKPIEPLPVQPIVDPKRESFTPATPTSVDKGMVVDPLRPTITKQPPPLPTDLDPNNPYRVNPTTGLGSPVGIKPIKAPLPNLIVDPKREPYTPPTPTSGLMPNSPKKRKAGMTPSQYSGVNTNVRGLMR